MLHNKKIYMMSVGNLYGSKLNMRIALARFNILDTNQLIDDALEVLISHIVTKNTLDVVKLSGK